MSAQTRRVAARAIDREVPVTTPPLIRELLNEPSAARAPAIAALLRELPPGTLPLQACCAHGGWVDQDDLEIRVRGVREDRQGLKAELDVFFTEVVGGCNCHDDPTRHPAYARLRLCIDRRTGDMDLAPAGD